MNPSGRSRQPPSGDERPARARRIETIAAMLGILLVATAIAANQHWLDKHFLPSFFLPRPWYVLIENVVRLAVAVCGIAIAVALRPRVGRIISRAPRTALSVVLSVVLALAASEVALRRVHVRPTEWLLPQEEPKRQPDPRLGWVLAPSRTGRSAVGGRTVEYAIDPAGYRVRRSGERVDVERAAIVFAGESVMFGEGLQWDETIPAQVESIVGIQSANLAVHGYSTDQAYLRLERELPRFRRPVAVVSIFMTELFGRNLDDDRPYLAPGLVWHPAEHASRLASLAGLLVPYRRDVTVERGVQMTREVLNATVDLARTRGATPLVVIPQFGPEDRSEQALRQRIVDERLPGLFVSIDAGWRLPWDRHPNAQAARVIAAAIAGRLQPRSRR